MEESIVPQGDVTEQSVLFAKNYILLELNQLYVKRLKLKSIILYIQNNHFLLIIDE